MRARAVAIVAILLGGAAAALLGLVLAASDAGAGASCTFYWTGAVSTNWGATGNWSLTNGGGSAGGLPGASDYVCMSTAPTRQSVVNTANRTIAGINFAVAGTVTPSLDLQAGTVTINTNASTINNLQLDSGTLTGSAALTMTGTDAITGSYTLAGAGTKTVAVGATMAQNGTLSVGTTSAGGGTPLVNNGAWTMAHDTSTSLAAPSSGTPSSIANAGTFTVQDDADINQASAGSIIANFVNSGSFTSTAPTTSNYVDVRFTNTGTVSTGATDLAFYDTNAATSTDTGTWTTSGAGAIRFDADRSLTAGSITGTTGAFVDGGVTTFSSGVTVSALTVSGGAAGGTASIGVLDLESGTLAGPGTLTVTGASTICGGTISGGLTLHNTGTITYGSDCGYIDLTGGSLIDNAGTFAIAPTSSNFGYLYDDGSGNGGFLNESGAALTVAMNTSADTVDIATPFTNKGSVTVTRGTLSIDAGNVTTSNADSGTISIAAGAVVDLTSGTRTVQAGTVTGAGTLGVTGGDVTFVSGVSLADLAVSGGTIHGSPTVTTLDFESGQATGAGTLTATGSASKLGSGTLDGGYTIANQGAMTYNSAAGYLQLDGGSSLVNSGSLTLGGTAGAYIYDDGNANDALINQSGATMTVNLDSAGQTLDIATPFSNAGGVTLSTGNLNLDDGNASGATSDNGSYALGAGTTLSFGGGVRAIASGTISGAGTLAVEGGDVSFASGVPVSNLTVDSGSITGSPVVANATLNGGTYTGPGTLTATGASSISAPNLQTGYVLLNQGTMSYTLTGYPYLVGGSKIENQGTFAVTGSPGGYIYDDGTGSFVNDAAGAVTVNFTAATTTFTLSTKLTNNGSITVTKGKADFSYGVSNLDGTGKLTGGSWIANGGTITLPAAVRNNAATIVLGSTGTFAPALTTLATNSGSLTIGRSVTASVALANSGTMVVTTGATYRVNSYTQSAGSLRVDSSSILQAGASGTAALALNGGVASGLGTLTGQVSNAASVSPGNGGAGTLSAGSGYTQAAGGTLSIVPGATQLATTGATALNGTLAIQAPASTPAIGTSVTVVSGGPVSGAFATVTGRDVPAAGGYWQVKYNANSVTLGLVAYPVASVNSVSTPEGDSGSTNQTFTVSLDGPSQLTATVNYATADGTATAGVDYTATSGTVTFAPGQTSQPVTVPVLGDTLYEPDETYSLTLSAPVDATLGTATGTGTITNDDIAPTISIGNASTSVYGGAGGTLTFPVTLSTVSAVDATASYATADGTAVAGVDYTATSGTVTIPAGSTTGSITVVALPKAPYAPPLTMTVTLSAPTAATLGTSTGTGTISNSNAGITSLTPKGQVFVGQPARTITVNGANFAPGSTVTVTGQNITVTQVTVVDAQTITARFAAAANATPGVRSVSVNSPGHGTATCANCLRVSLQPSATSVTPSTIPRNTSTPVALTITGSNFATGAKVGFVPAHGMVLAAGSTTVVNSTTITASVTAKQYVALGAYTVNVTNPDTGFATCSGCLTVQGPTITSVSPNVIRRNVPVTVTITGTNLDPAAVVSGVGCTTTTNAGGTTTTASATITCGLASTLGKRSITLTNSDGGSFTLAGALTETGPTITSISPTSVQRGTSANLTITGTGFANGAMLSIAGTCTFSNVHFVNSTTLTATITCPSNAATGAKQIVVTDPASVGSSQGAYTGFSVTP